MYFCLHAGFTLKIEAFELSFRDTKWDGLSTVINILAGKEVRVQRHKFVRASSTEGLWMLKMYQSGRSIAPPFLVKWAL